LKLQELYKITEIDVSNNYEEKVINNISEYVAILNSKKQEREKQLKNADFIFRGQRQDWPLLSKLVRRLDERRIRGDVITIERLITAEFERLSLPLAELQPQNDWEKLALAQHHGLPTCLIDWSFSALAALWFAVSLPPDKKDGICLDGVVWIYMPSVIDFTINYLSSPFDIEQVKIYRPKAISKRIVAQQGVFTVHSIYYVEGTQPFENNIEYNNNLVKLIIPNDQFPAFRKDLNMLGINCYTLFPDLDGLCKYLEWRYIRQEDE